MADGAKGWRPDPFGMHELRYFAMDGRPTRLVRDAEVLSHDPPRGTVPFVDGPRPLRSPRAHLQLFNADDPPHVLPAVVEGRLGDDVEVGFRPPLHGWEPPLKVVDAQPSPPADGWQIDPSGQHEYRYFHRGQPTAYVTDSRQQSTDRPSVRTGNLAFAPRDTAAAKTPALTAEPDREPSKSRSPTVADGFGRTLRFWRIRRVFRRIRPHRSQARLPVADLRFGPGEEEQAGVDPATRLGDGPATVSGAHRGVGGQPVAWLADSYGFSPNGAGSSKN